MNYNSKFERYAFIIPSAIITAVFAVEVLLCGGTSMHTRDLIAMGALTETSSIHTYLTSVFLHANLMHFINNLLSLTLLTFILINKLEIRVSYVYTTILISSIFGNIATAVASESYVCVGISGGIYGLLGLSIIFSSMKSKMYPANKMYSLLTDVCVFTGLLDIAMSISNNAFLANSGVTNITSHMVGLLTGMLIAIISNKKALHIS